MGKDTERTFNYSNTKDMPIRTRCAIFVLLIIVKLLEPWEYSHQFEDDFKALREILLTREKS